jgi:hypothetical protein
VGKKGPCGEVGAKRNACRAQPRFPDLQNAHQRPGEQKQTPLRPGVASTHTPCASRASLLSTRQLPLSPQPMDRTSMWRTLGGSGNVERHLRAGRAGVQG